MKSTLKVAGLLQNLDLLQNYDIPIVERDLHFMVRAFSGTPK